MLWLALWKVKIEGCKIATETANERDKESSPKRCRLDKSHLDGVERQSCLVDSGADVVISNVLPFLDKVCRKDFCVLGDQDALARCGRGQVFVLVQDVSFSSASAGGKCW
jgi:hypothetical protein